MAKNGYTVTRSNYTLKEFHKNAPKGEIYERDLMTTTNLSGWENGVFPHGENGFKMVFNDSKTGSRAHKFGEYLKHIANGGETDVWTLSDGASKDYAGSDGEIRLKSNNTTLLSYAYFGSCTELVKSTIKHIIENFPAEAYSNTEETFITKDMIGEACGIDVDKWYVFNNPFNIDFMTDKIINSDALNPLRHFQTSYTRYRIFLDSEYVDCVNNVDIFCVNDDFCGLDGTWDKIISLSVNGLPVYIMRFFFNNEPYYITSMQNFTLIPCDEDIDLFFNGLDDFEKLLLNRKSYPKYTATLDFPHETERGIETYKKHFTWPTDDSGWNLDITTQIYASYVNDLLTLSEFYDNYKTDNLWRMMTHDSIKNMDMAFSRSDVEDEDEEDYNEGTTKVQGLLWAYGRMFDELKRYIDNIRDTNKITYNQQGNLPDYFLSDTLGLSGWEVSNSVYTLDKDATIISEKTGEEYGVVDANIRFLNSLKIGTKQIFSRKGTRYGIEMILGLFGYRSDDFKGKGNGNYKIDEEVSIATVKGVGTTHCPVYSGTVENNLSAEEYGAYRENLETDGGEYNIISKVDRLPVSIFYYNRYVYTEVIGNDSYLSISVEKQSVPEFANDCDPEMIRINVGSEEQKHYKYYNKVAEQWKTIIPWFIAAEDMDGNPYFQMKGGWGKIDGKEYSETLNYLNLSETISGLRNLLPGNVRESDNGTICYVSDISDFSDYFSGTPTNYFVLKNVENLDIIGNGGWLPVTDPDTKAHVEYLDKIIDEYRGNNPHVGFDNYDDGKEFFEYIKQIFKGSIKDDVFGDNAYDCESGEIISGISEQGFNVSEPAIDNKKCWYFYDKSQYNLEDPGMQELFVEDDGYTYDASGMSYVEGFEYEGIEPSDVRGDYGGNSDNNTIYAEPSVVNRKNLIITFRTGNEDEIRYIKETVMPYLTQVVPSTSLLEIKFEN